jgi:hypothetical protein
MLTIKNRVPYPAVKPALPTAAAVFLTVRAFREPRALPETTFYRLVKAGVIKTCKRGKRTLISVDEALRFDQRLLAGDLAAKQ